jgi:hypothetical protein
MRKKLKNRSRMRNKKLWSKMMVAKKKTHSLFNQDHRVYFWQSKRKIRKYKRKENMLPPKSQLFCQVMIRKRENKSFKKKEKKHFLSVNIEMILLKMMKPIRLEYKMRLLKKSKESSGKRHHCRRIILCVYLNRKKRNFGKNNLFKSMHVQIL